MARPGGGDPSRSTTPPSRPFDEQTYNELYNPQPQQTPGSGGGSGTATTDMDPLGLAAQQTEAEQYHGSQYTGYFMLPDGSYIQDGPQAFPDLTPTQMQNYLAWQRAQGQDPVFDIGGAGGGGGGRGGRGGRGGGGSARVYVGPDPDAVRNMVKGTVVSLLGQAHDDVISQGVSAFLAADRAKFDGQPIDPSMQVLKLIRETARYKDIHEHRPDSFDEEEWIGAQQQSLLGAGVRPDRASNMAIQFARLGVNPARAGEYAQIRHMARTGKALPAYRAQITRVAQAVAGMI